MEADMRSSDNKLCFTTVAAQVLAAILWASLSAPSAAQARPPSIVEVIQQTMKSYASAKTPEDLKSIEMWCRDAIVANNFPADVFLLNRAIMDAKDEAASAALTAMAIALRKLVDAQADLLCPPGAIR